MTKNILKNIETPQFQDALDQLKKDIFYTLNCVQVGVIQSFDDTNQTASVLIAIKKIKETLADGTKILQERPVLLQVPVFVLYGGNSFITMPIQSGDSCIILFNDRQIDEWFLTGGVAAPSTSRAHDLSDAIAIIGLRSLQNSIDDYLTNGIRIAFNSSSKIDITDDEIESIAELFTQNGNMLIKGDLTVEQNMIILGDVEGSGGTVNFNANLTQGAGQTISAGNGATGTFNIVSVVNGIVVGGS